MDVQVTLAGLGSRFVASIIDSLIKGAIVVALAVALAGASALFDLPSALSDESVSAIMAIVLSVAIFVMFFVYDVAFEVLASGRTPGKRVAGLRVVRDGGEPIGFLASCVRNILRLVDFLPTSYGVGAVSVLLSSRNKRLGDLAAGTIVVMEPATKAPRPSATSPELVEQARTWDVSGITQDELTAVRRFLTRRADLEPAARRRIATELTERLRPRVPGAPPELSPEDFLTRLEAVKLARS